MLKRQVDEINKNKLAGKSRDGFLKLISQFLMKIGQSNGIENLLATFCYFAKSCTTGLKLVKIVMNRVLIPIDRITKAVSSKPKVI